MMDNHFKYLVAYQNPARDALHFAWLTRLRWSSIAGQLVVILGTQWLLGLALPTGWLLVVLVLEGVHALVAHANRRPITPGILAASLALDLVSVTGLLYLSGGPSNPFNFLYLVQLALASVVLPAKLTWALMVAASVLFGALFFDHVPLAFFDPGVHQEAHQTEHQTPPVVDHEHNTDHVHHVENQPTATPSTPSPLTAHNHDDPIHRLHLQGMWVAFVVAAGFIVYFVSRLTKTLALRDTELARARDLTARTERLASLTTLAAGAAHELASPLGTIAVVVGDLARDLDLDPHANPALRDDVALIRSQVQQCRAVLDRLSIDTGFGRGEPPAVVSIGDVFDALPLNAAQRDRVKITRPDPPLYVCVSLRAFTRALGGLVENALRASPASAQVQVLACPKPPNRLSLDIIDSGPGMTPETLARVGEPFFTTQPPGQGMGLGLFLARTITEQMGGDLQITSTPDQGTQVHISLPLSPAPNNLPHNPQHNPPATSPPLTRP